MAVSRRLRFEVLRRDGHACRYCGRTAPEVKLTVDHVMPTALGGRDDPTNLVAACSECNAGKSAANPDATVVATVADDALRWAAAIRQSAETMLADLARREAQRLEFRREWDSWQFGSKKMRLPLPDSWELSVDQFVAVGLPMPLLIDALKKAMQTKTVQPVDTFRYMCGIAWNLVREMQASARAYTGDAPAVSAPVVTASALAGELWGTLPYRMDEDRVREWAAAQREQWIEDEEEADRSHWPDDACAFVYAVLKLSEEHYYADISGRLLKKLPPRTYSYWMSKASAVHTQYNVTPTNIELESMAAVLAFEYYYENSDHDLDDQPPFGTVEPESPF